MVAFRTLTFWLVALGVMAGLASWMPSGARADALRRIERETRRDSDDRGTRRSRDDDGGGRRGRDSSRSSTGWVRVEDYHRDVFEDVAVFTKLLLFPWTIPHIMLEQAGEPERMELHGCLKRYARVPFQNGPGILRSGCDESTRDEVSGLIGLSSESGFMLQQVVPASFAVRVLLPKRLELSGRADWWFDVAEGSSDRAWMNTTNFVYRFAQSQRVDLRTGAGLRYYKLDDPRFGLDLLYGIDVYGRRPIVFRVELHAGILGDAGFGQARATLGGMIGRMELYAGYDHTYLSDGQGAGAKIGGPIGGVRAWF